MNCKSQTPCWVPVSELLPDVGQPVLCWPPKCFEGHPTDYVVVLQQHKDKRWFVVEENGIVYNHEPTHWMPLPKAPNNQVELQEGSEAE